MNSTLILASASPRRRELLAQAGYRFAVEPSSIPESRRPEEDAIRFATRLAREKAEEVFARHPPSPTPAMVLGADTVVVCDGEVMGKPADAADAQRMLLLLSGRTHQVVTGVAVVWGSGSAEVAAEMTQVTMRTLSSQEDRRLCRRLGSPWIRPAPMPSRVMPEDGFPASTVATSTSSVCRWPWSTSLLEGAELRMASQHDPAKAL